MWAPDDHHITSLGNLKPGIPRCEMLSFFLKDPSPFPLGIAEHIDLGIRPSVSQQKPNHFSPHCLISGAWLPAEGGGVHGFLGRWLLPAWLIPCYSTRSFRLGTLFPQGRDLWLGFAPVLFFAQCLRVSRTRCLQRRRRLTAKV